MVSLSIDYVSPVEVLVELVTRPSDGKHFFLDLCITRFSIGQGSGSVTQAGPLAAIQHLNQTGLYHIGQ